MFCLSLLLMNLFHKVPTTAPTPSPTKKNTKAVREAYKVKVLKFKVPDLPLPAQPAARTKTLQVLEQATALVLAIEEEKVKAEVVAARERRLGATLERVQVSVWFRG